MISRCIEVICNVVPLRISVIANPLAEKDATDSDGLVFSTTFETVRCFGGIVSKLGE
jgi:hypothetical protein